MIKKILFTISLFVIALIPLEAIAATEGVSFGRYAYYLLIFFSLFYLQGLIPRRRNYLLILIAFTFFALISMFWTNYPDETAFRSIQLLQFLSIAILLDNLIKKEKQVINIMLAWIFGCFFISIKAIIDFVQNGWISTERIYRVTLVGNPNENSFMIVFGMILAIILIYDLKSNRKIKTFSILYLIVATLAIFANGSRGGFLMFVTTIVLYFITSIKYLKIKHFILIFLSIGIVLQLLFKYLPQLTIVRLLDTGHAIKGMELSQREVIWNNAYNMIQSFNFNFLIGKGWGTFPLEYKMFTSGDFYGAHNFFITTFFTLGIVGFALLIFYLIILLKKIISIDQKFNFFYYALLLIPIISMMSTNWEIRKWWLIIGVFIVKISDYKKLTIITNIGK